jgi:hypothetical protein
MHGEPSSDAMSAALARITKLARQTLARSAVEGVRDYIVHIEGATALDGYVLTFRTLADAERIPFALYLFMVGWRLNVESRLLAITASLASYKREEAWKQAHGGRDFDRREAEACAAHGVTPDDIVDLLDEDPPPQWLTDLFEEAETHYQGFPEYGDFERDREGLRDRICRTLYEQHAPDLLAVAQHVDDWRRRWEEGRRMAEQLGLWEPGTINDASDSDRWIYVAGENGPTTAH